MEVRQYIDFHDVPTTTKTRVISVDSRRGGYRLALIKWYPSWRQYVLYPEPHTVWNAGCLREVESYIQGLMAERKNAARSLAVDDRDVRE